MKRLIMIGGTMGVGKTTVSSILKNDLDKSVFLDGDWCWDMHPFVVNDETKRMVMNNIIYQLNQFLHCSSIENIIFCWVMDEQEIIDEIISGLDVRDYQAILISLICHPNQLQQHLQKDIDLGIRHSDIIFKSIARLDKYSYLHTKKIDVSNQTSQEVAFKIRNLLL